MTLQRLLARYSWPVLVLAPVIGAAQHGPDQFTIDNKILSIGSSHGFVEIAVDDRIPLPARAVLVQTFSVGSVTPTRFRALIDPDSLARFLDSAETTIADLRARHSTGYDEIKMGSVGSFYLSFRDAVPTFGHWIGALRVQGCSAKGIYSYVDSATNQRVVQSLRRAVQQARMLRSRTRRLGDAGIACEARLLPATVVVPTIARGDARVSERMDAFAIIDADSNGKVSRLSWRSRVPGIGRLDSAMRQWRFRPATGALGPRAGRVTFRIRYGVDDARLDLDSLARFLAPSSGLPTDYAVVGHVIDQQSTRTVVSGDVRLHVDDGGASIGAPVLIALGAGGRVSQLSAILEHLRQQRRAITYDPRGHGQSSAASDYSVDAQIEDITSVLDSLHLDHVVLAGVGSGGIAAVEVARRQPQRVIGVALLGPAGDYLLEDTPKANVIDSIRRELTGTGRPTALTRFFQPADSLFLAWVARDLRSTPREAVLGMLDASARYDFAPAMAEYTGPRMILIPSGTTGPLRAPLAAARDSVFRESGGTRCLHLTSALEVARRLEAFVYSAEWLNKQ